MLIAEKFAAQGYKIEVEFEGVVLESTPKEVSLVFEEMFIKDIRIDETVILQDMSTCNVFKFLLEFNSKSFSLKIEF